MEDSPSIVPSSAKDAASQYGFAYRDDHAGLRGDRKEFNANVTNEIAMALLNADLEHAVWQRDTAYNDPREQYSRLTAAGMNPVLAMHAIAGVGNISPTVGVPSGSAVPQNYGASRMGLISNVLTGARNISDAAQQLSSIRLTNAEAENREIKNRFEVRRQEGEVGLLRLDLEKYNRTFNEQVNTIKSQYYNLTKENRLLDERVDNLAEQTRGLQLSNDFSQKTLDNRVATVSKQLEKLGYESSQAEYAAAIKSVESALADSGILNGQNWVQSIVSVAALGKGKDATEAASRFVSDVLGQVGQELPSILSSLVTGLVQALASAPGAVLEGLGKSFGN